MKKIIIGNWKMNPATLKEAEMLFSGVSKGISSIKKTKVLICPPFLYLEKLSRHSRVTGLKISLGAQDVSFEEKGPFTGEVSGEMLYSMGVKYVIVGHSERRAMGETNIDVNKKIKASLGVGLIPILCIGESMRDESHSYFNLVKTQLEECLEGIKKDLVSKVIVAYEPIWAISSTINRHDATPNDSREMTIFIRKILSDKFGSVASFIQIIYGGSVNEKDAPEFLKDGGVEGLLAGKSSLDVKKFIEIIKTCEALSK